MKTTSPSELDRRITLYYTTKVPDGMGGQDETEVDVATIWAKKTPHRSDEAVQGMMTTGFAVYNYRIQYRRGIKSHLRIKDGNARLNITGPPVPVERGRYMDITAKEAVI